MQELVHCQAEFKRDTLRVKGVKMITEKTKATFGCDKKGKVKGKGKWPRRMCKNRVGNKLIQFLHNLLQVGYYVKQLCEEKVIQSNPVYKSTDHTGREC